MTKHNMRIFGVSPFFVQKTLKQQLNGEKWDVGYVSAFGQAVLLFWCSAFGSFHHLTVI